MAKWLINGDSDLAEPQGIRKGHRVAEREASALCALGLGCVTQRAQEPEGQSRICHW